MSVVVCVYNGADVIGEQLGALAAQDVDFEWEVVVAENRSTDGTKEVLLKRQPGFPVPLRVVDAWERQGVAHARNVGVKASRGHLLAFCDADDRVAPGWLQAAADALDSADMAGGARRELRSPFDSEAPFTEEPVLAQGFNGPTVLGNNFAVRREVYFAVGGMDEGFPRYGLDDVELCARVNGGGYRIAFAPSMVVYFRPTVGTRELMRKVFLSGKAEYLVWSLYPTYFAKERTLASILGEPFVAVWSAFRSLVSSRRVPARELIRSWIEAAAHLSQHRSTRAGTRLPMRALLSPEDDSGFGG